MLTRSRFLIIFSLLVLSACNADDVNMEKRDITVQETASPAGNIPITPNIAAVVGRVSPSYVTVTVSKINKFGTARDHDNRSAVTSGSGYVVEGDGYIMTAAHVAVKPGNSISARAGNGRIYTGTVISTLPSNDIALIKLRGFQGHAVEPVPNSCLPKGTELFSLGKPHAQGDTARFGTVASMSYGQAVSYGEFGYPDAMVMRMSTQKGESGGPVFDTQGRLAGMVVSTLTDSNGEPLNLAHAVPVSRLAQFLCQNTQCSPVWSNMAAQADKPCPG